MLPAAALSLMPVITTASKVAFIGWGVGSAAVDFTGVSGHAMSAAAAYPMLMLALASNGSACGRGFSFASRGALALAVGLIRIAVGAHSWSEVWAGLLVGDAVGAAALVLAKRVTVHKTIDNYSKAGFHYQGTSPSTSAEQLC